MSAPWLEPTLVAFFEIAALALPASLTLIASMVGLLLWLMSWTVGIATTRSLPSSGLMSLLKSVPELDVMACWRRWSAWPPCGTFFTRFPTCLAWSLFRLVLMATTSGLFLGM